MPAGDLAALSLSKYFNDKGRFINEVQTIQLFMISK